MQTCKFADYSSWANKDNEQPVPDMFTLPSENDHRMRHGTVHPVQVGLRLVEEMRMRCKEAVEQDPLKAVAIIYERELTKIKASLEGHLAPRGAKNEQAFSGVILKSERPSGPLFTRSGPPFFYF